MKRSSFIKSALAAASGLAMPFTLLAKRLSGQKAEKGFFVAAGKDRFDKSLSLFDGDTFFCKVSTKDTDGSMYMIETIRNKKGGPPLHFHYDQDEWWYVQQGEFLIKVGDQVFHAKAGDSVFGPRRVPHAFTKIGEGEAKMLISFQPSGKMEEIFKAISEGATKNMTDDERNEFRKAHGFEVVGPAIDFLKQ